MEAWVLGGKVARGTPSSPGPEGWAYVNPQSHTQAAPHSPHVQTTYTFRMYVCMYSFIQSNLHTQCGT